jgi:putative nucleotidyltransferase with HDIG domain
MNKNKTGPVSERDFEESDFRSFIFLLDQDKKRVRQLNEFLLSQGFKVQIAPSLQSLNELPPDKNNFYLIIWQVNQLQDFLPEIASRIKKRLGQVALLLLAPPDEKNQDLRLIQQGLINQLVSPGHPSALLSAIQSEIQKENYRRQLAQKKMELRQINLTREKAARRVEELEGLYNATLENLMTALDLRDVETFGHSKVVARYSLALARILGINDSNQLEKIHQGALLHDVGKIAIPDSILKKPARLTNSEWEKIKLHPAVGYGLIKEINLPEVVGNIILYHHEYFDGTGYPFGLKENKIPLEARIFALADALDAITSHRPYRPPRSFDEARKEILLARGTQFDPLIVEAFCSLSLQEWEKIRFETTKILPALENLKTLNRA